MDVFISTIQTVIWLMVFCTVSLNFSTLKAQSPAPQFRVIAFYTGKDDLAHISFVHEANDGFPDGGEISFCIRGDHELE